MKQMRMSGRELEEKLDRIISVLTAAKLPRTRILTQLRASGRYPFELLRARFPELPEESFASPLPAPVPAGPLRPAGDVVVEMICKAPKETNTTKHRARSRASTALSTAPVSRSTQPASSVSASAVAQPAVADIFEKQKISFQYVPLIQCSFPHTDPGETTTYTRRNGWLELTLTTNRPAVGLPYGVPARILTIYCATEAVRTRSPEIFLGRSVHDFLRKLEIPITRGEHGSLRSYTNQLMRLIHCVVSIDEDRVDADGRTGLHLRQALFVEEASLWWDEAVGVGQGSSILLSRPLFESILERSAPLATSAIKALRRSPMDLDIYAWLAHRLYHLRRPSQVRWEQLSEQFGHGYAELRFFRRYFIDSLKRVLRVYSDANVSLNEHGLLLRSSRPHIVPKTRSPV